DADAASAQLRDFMADRALDVVGIRRHGRVVGYVERRSLENGACGACLRPLSEAAVVDDTTPLLGVLAALSVAPFVFVTALGSVCGIVRLADLQKPPVRMWLFGIVTLIEMRCAELIEEHCPGDAWKQYLSEARLQKAEALLAERSRRSQSLRLLDCLQFS